MRGRLTERLLSFLSPLLLLAIWELATRAGWLNKLFFPPPSSIVGTLRLQWERGTVQANRVVRYKTSPSRHECDARCVNATGRTMNCECACGGKNHGAGFSSAPAF